MLYSRIENGYYDEIVDKSKLKPYEEHSAAEIVYDENRNEIGVGFVSKENYDKCNAAFVYSDGTPVREYTFENYYNKTENIGPVIWYTDFSLIFEKPKTSFSKIPHDTITVEVTFNDVLLKSSNMIFHLTKTANLLLTE
ncbi:MAG: hypothetical protein K2G22_07295 [Eubacterium sp.]|nr:hypothetical protein [Eubacterium sp.]